MRFVHRYRCSGFSALCLTTGKATAAHSVLFEKRSRESRRIAWKHGYPPLLLSLESWDKLDHVIFVFQKNGLWGSVGRSRDFGLHGRRPVFRRLRDLAWSYFDTYVDLSGRLTGYGLANLYDLGNYDWRFTSKNVWKVEEHLRVIPHRSIHSSDRRYEKWHERYKEFKKLYPDKRPAYYDNRHQWLR